MKGEIDITLTPEQSRIVEENHNLIYWYISMKQKMGINLELDEWYDLLAIELCYTVMKYDESRGSLANYFKLRCDALISKEYRKSQTQKRVHIGVSYIDEMSMMDTPKEDSSLVWVDFINSIPEQDRPIVKMIYDGYTQKEVATMLGVTQSYVSKILKRIGKEYNARVD